MSVTTPAFGHVPFTVRARLERAAALNARVGPCLDGLLASVTRDRARSTGDGPPVPGSLLDGGLDVDDPATVNLPLTACADPDTRLWHWACTTGTPVGHDGQPVTGDPQVTHLTGRLHETMFPAVQPLPGSVPLARGRYRARYVPVVTTPAAAILWYGVGDPDQVADLLHDVTHVGGRRGTGEGHVLDWQVTACQGADTHRFAHAHPDGRLGRPCPVGCATRFTGWTQGIAGLQPPYWHRSRQHLLAVPDHP